MKWSYLSLDLILKFNTVWAKTTKLYCRKQCLKVIVAGKILVTSTLFKASFFITWQQPPPTPSHCCHIWESTTIILLKVGQRLELKTGRWHVLLVNESFLRWYRLDLSTFHIMSLLSANLWAQTLNQKVPKTARHPRGRLGLKQPPLDPTFKMTTSHVCQLIEWLNFDSWQDFRCLQVWIFFSFFWVTMV